MANDPENECEFCGEDHETRNCEEDFCVVCRDGLDNCECEDDNGANIVSAGEWYEQHGSFS